MLIYWGLSWVHFFKFHFLFHHCPHSYGFVKCWSGLFNLFTLLTFSFIDKLYIHNYTRVLWESYPPKISYSLLGIPMTFFCVQQWHFQCISLNSVSLWVCSLVNIITSHFLFWYKFISFPTFWAGCCMVSLARVQQGSIFIFSQSRQPGKYSKKHACPGKILVALSKVENYR